MNIIPILVTIIIDVILCIIVGAIAARDKKRNGIAWFSASLFVTPLFASLFLIIFTLQDSAGVTLQESAVVTVAADLSSKRIRCSSCNNVFSTMFAESGLSGGSIDCPKCGTEINDATVEFFI